MVKGPLSATSASPAPGTHGMTRPWMIPQRTRLPRPTSRANRSRSRRQACDFLVVNWTGRPDVPGLGRLLKSYGAKPSSVPHTRWRRCAVWARSPYAPSPSAAVSHGTVLFHFKRHDELVTTLLDRVLVATTQVSVPDDVDRLTTQWGKLLTVVRAEMERLSANPRSFICSSNIRRSACEARESGGRFVSDSRRIATSFSPSRRRFCMARRARRPNASTASTAATLSTAEGLAGVAVSLVHGCALQAVIDPKRFDADQPFDAAARLLDRWRHPPNGRRSMDAP